MQKYLSTFIFVIGFFPCFAQIGGNSTYRFLNLPNSAKTAALGGSYPTHYQSDFTDVFNNPSLLDIKYQNTLDLNYSNYVSDINYGSLQYGFKYKSSLLSLGLLYVNYGDFLETNDSGNETGNTFKASDYLLNIGFAKTINSKIKLGANGKVIYSAYESYQSLALAVDVAANYQDTTNNLSAGLIVKNLGYQIKPFAQTRESLPLKLDVSFSQKLKYAPFKYHITYQNLQKFNLNTGINSTEIDILTGESLNSGNSFGSNLSKHFILGTELLLTSSFNLLAAYNFEKGKDLSVTGTGSASGLSFGLAIKLKKFSFYYANSKLNAAGSNNYFSLQITPNFK
jgi:hypothetical protein